jgi:hypothetical protein
MMRPADNWGTPDPRDSGAYPSTASMKQWAWEFLRRRVDYRRAWQERVQPFVVDGRFDLAAVSRNNLETFSGATFKSPRRPPWEALRDDFKVYGDPVSCTLHNRTLDPRFEQPPWFAGT